jgi:VWFA-related protein
LRDGKDRASVVSFDTGVHLYQRTTGSREQIAAALLELESPKEQATLLYDAVAVASEGLMRKEQGRKAFMLISDGLDYGSKASISLAIEYAQRADVLIYSILFADTVSGYGPAMSEQQAFMNRALGSKVMRRLSRETGAGFFEVSKSKPVEKIYDEIAEELRNQYSIGYTPDRSSSNGAFRKIKLTVKGKGLIVRTREGYYP